MDVEWGPDVEWGSGPRLDEFLLARIAEDKRVATDAAEVADEEWTTRACKPRSRTSGRPSTWPGSIRAASHAECTAKRGMVLACRESRPDMQFLGSRPRGMDDFPLQPRDQHQLAALTLALLALPYAGHRDYREEWRP